jgi:hypothetical protein
MQIAQQVHLRAPSSPRMSCRRSGRNWPHRHADGTVFTTRPSSRRWVAACICSRFALPLLEPRESTLERPVLRLVQRARCAPVRLQSRAARHKRAQ